MCASTYMCFLLVVDEKGFYVCECALQHELAQASAEKVRNLEREREHMVNSFNSRVAILDGTLYQCKQQQADADSMLRVCKQVYMCSAPSLTIVTIQDTL